MRLRSLTCTMQRVTAGPRFPMALGELVIILPEHRCRRAWCFLQEAFQVGDASITLLVFCCCLFAVLFVSARLCSFVFMYFLVSSVASSVVDMYNATSNSWTSFPNGLGQARSHLAGASLPSGLVFFAGGLSGRRRFDHDCFLI